MSVQRAGAALLLLAVPLAWACRPGKPPAEPAQDSPAPHGAFARPQRGHPEPGWWTRSRETAATDTLDPEQREKLEELASLGYVSGSVERSADRVITIHDEDRAFAGFNFYNSGHGPEAVLMDMQGEELHRWSHEFLEVWPKARLETVPPQSRDWWRRVHVMENGDLLAIFEGVGLIRLDAASNLLWVRPIGAHHDLDVTADGRIHVLTRQGRIVPSVHDTLPILVDSVTVLDGEGTVLSRTSLLECFENAGFDFRPPAGTAPHADLFHTNSLQVLDGRFAERIPEFRAGNVLISSRTLDRIAVIDPRRKKVVWTETGTFKKQHDAVLLDNGNLMLFDNLGRTGASTVYEFDPLSWDVVWEYGGSADRPFLSEWSGTAQRLANGNTLITESDYGRAFEVTAAGEPVWEFHNPHRAGPQGEYIATLLEVVRLPSGFPVEWTQARRGIAVPRARR